MKKVLFSIALFTFAVVSFASSIRWYDGIQAVTYQFMTPVESVVRVGAALFEQDMFDVTGKRALCSDRAQILLYEFDTTTDQQKKELKKEGIDITLLATSIDAFQLKVVSAKKIIVVGSNGRGVAYGLLELSRMAGVSPWVWWGDVVPEKKSVLSIDSKTDIKHKASVELRGIFINDEDWSTRHWSHTNFSPSEKGEIGCKTYRKIFELLLRLRANTIWPGMHPGTEAFFKTHGGKAEADSCGIYIGTSHCEPLLRNNVGEWDVKERGAFNYVSNKQAVQDYWTERLKEVKSSKTNIFTIGMRGIHDGSMEGVKTMDEKFTALQQVIDDQQKLIAEHIGTPSDQTQVFVPYKEVLELYEMGLKIPDYVTLMWCDDNYGYMTRLSNPNEQKRSGGGGVYYHLSYWGRPHDYLWLTTTQPGLIYSEMTAAYNHNVRKLWVANVHDVKVAGYDLELFLDMAWDINSVSADGVGVHYKQWLANMYGTDVAENIYPAMRKFFELTGKRKPEHMGWTQVELDKKKYVRGLSLVEGTELSTTEFGNEKQRYLNEYEQIRATVEKAAETVRKDLQDSYFAHIIYPVSAASCMAHKILDNDNGAYQEICSLTQKYNNLSNGKWLGLMNMNPRDLPVFRNVEEMLKDPTSAMKPQHDSKSNIQDSTIYISRSASSFMSAGKGVKVIDMLGHSMSAVSLPKGESLSYSFTCDSEADAILYTALIPTQPNDNGDIRYAVSIDGGKETVFSLKEKFRSEQWKLNVLRQQAVRQQRIHLTTGSHILTIRALDDHIIVDQWMIDFNTKRGKFYLFPQQ